MAEPKEKTTSFTEMINSDTPLLVDFHADWCGPCKMMAPILKNLKKEMGEDLQIIKIDVDKNSDAAIKYQVRGVPTLILFHKGNLLWQQSGVVQLPQLKQMIRQKLSLQ
ncbi:MAG: thioredoxin [Balneolaceae bacterium]